MPTLQYNDKYEKYRLKGLWFEMMAEFIGTMVLVMFGDGVVAATLYGPYVGGSTIINLAWGLAVVFGCMVSIYKF